MKKHALPPGNSLSGCRIVVAEDNALVSLQLQRMLAQLGYTVVGSATDLESAQRLCATVNFDAAVLDINLRGATVYPLALELRARSQSFVLATGYDFNALPDALRDAVLLEKPHDKRELAVALGQALARGRGTPPAG